MIETTAFDFAEKFIGFKEIPGPKDHPFIQWCLSLCYDGTFGLHDEIPNCSAWMNGICFLLDLPRSESAAARSWLRVGREVPLEEAGPGNDIVVFSRGPLPQPGPEVIKAQGHVALYGGYIGNMVLARGGNQGDEFNDSWFPLDRVLGFRRLWE